MAYHKKNYYCKEYVPKIDISVGTIDIGNVRLNFWDLGGQEELQSLWDKVCHRLCETTHMMVIMIWYWMQFLDMLLQSHYGMR